MLRYEIMAHGKLAHSAYPELGESAIEKLLDALEAVRAIALPDDPLLGPTTLNIGVISGGRAPNVIPDAAMAEIAIRLVGDPEPVRAAIAARRRRSRRSARGALHSGDALRSAGRIRDVRRRVHDGYSRRLTAPGASRSCSGRATSTWRTPAKSALPKRELAEAARDLSAHGASASGAHPRTASTAVHETMNLAIVGYGKMGRLVEQLAPEYGFAVPLRLDIDDNANGERHHARAFPRHRRGRGIFDARLGRRENIERLAAIGVNTVVGTTGWTEQLRARARRRGKRRHRTGVESEFFHWRECVHAPGRGGFAAARCPIRNTAPGPGRFITPPRKTRPAARCCKLVEEMKKADPRAPVDASSNRAGAHPGTHEIGFDSAADTITLRHTARSREGFARGALEAARWVVGKKGCLRVSRCNLVFEEVKEPSASVEPMAACPCSADAARLW